MRAQNPKEVAKKISRALITASNNSNPIRSWNPSLEQKLHQLDCRSSLNPLLVAQVIDPFLLHHHSLALGFFNWASQQPNFSHCSLTYQSILKSLSISRQFNEVEKLIKDIKTHNVLLHPSIYRAVIASQIVGKKARNAFVIFNDIGSFGDEIGHEVCNSLLAALASDGYVDFAKTMFDEMFVRGICFSTVGFGVFIGKFCRVCELDELLRLVEGVKRCVSMINGSVIAVLIIDGLCKVGRVHEASRVLDELRSRDCKPDFMAYRIVAEAFRAEGEFVETEKVLKRKRKFGVAPRANDYREFLLNLISEKRIQEAKELGQVIIEGNFAIEDDVLNVLIGSVSAIDPPSAILFFKFMMEKEGFPSLITLNNLSRNLCKKGKTEELVEVYHILSSKDYFSNMERYNMMISFLCTAGRVKEAYAGIQEMKKKGFGPDVFSYNSVMEACCREDLLPPAKRLWDEMFANGCCGNLKTYNILIRKLSKMGEVEEARCLFNHMLENGLAPDIVTYTSLIKGLCQEAKVGAACEIFKMSVEQDITLAQLILTALVHSLCKEGNSLAASRLIRGLPPDIIDHECHVVLLKGLSDSGDTGMALEHIQWVGDNSPSILKAVSAELVTSLSSSLKPGPVVQLIRVMMGKGLVSYDDTWMDICDEISLTRC
ncbi:hypothetical protein IFM89_017107 [Coptis chinensis]|uniref:Pentatricopeptide repeat-containing protein n=1 Tax=Coptis chinensis TaxID=261450 RepID=A0A835HMM5_9MAGN|nr:hypothetical protein IFM89_017107 [Coptis chinensis]